MFLIEGFLKERKRKIAKWESDRDEWLNAGEHRSPSTYAYYNPHPIKDYGDVLRYVGGGVMAVILGFLFFMLIQDSVKQHKAERNATTAGKNCRMFNREDTIRITTGEYKDTQGKIVGGCNNGDDYQIKLADGSFADIDGDSQGRIMVGTRVIAIGSYKDLVAIEEPKDAVPNK